MIRAIIDVLIERRDWFLQLLAEHMFLSAVAILIAGSAGLVLGILIAENQRVAPFVLGITNVVYTIPSIALLGMLIPLLGVGNKSAIVALSVYALLPMVRNTYAGINSIDPEIIEAARGMGSTRWQILLRVKLPLAMAIIVAGLRNMVVMTIALAGIASYIGAGGLGSAIYRGITVKNAALTFAGSIVIALLALVCDLLLGLLEKHLKRKWRMS